MTFTKPDFFDPVFLCRFVKLFIGFSVFYSSEAETQNRSVQN